ncbi:MAG: DUF3365 domain-containing protein [Candidatus Glassbacteria bacterium]|nr:DUF3365 domain-containing protein [Candidatus Glassbacteria bacterium]
MGKESKVFLTWPHHLRPLILSVAVFWTLIIGAALWRGFIQVENNNNEDAFLEAKVAFSKDLLYRRWAARHGGVYVPITEETPPNPYLSHVEERDITASSGKRLTLINPACMTRQVNELSLGENGLRGHITSLKLIRPENAPDPWERTALEAFERGEAEVSSIAFIEGKAHMRMMRPLITEERCLKCHAAQGYSAGDIRGGISVSVPMAPHLAQAKKMKTSLLYELSVIWLLGLLGIAVADRRIRAHENSRNAAEKELRKHREGLEQLIEERTADLKRTNEELKSEITERKQAEEALRESERYLVKAQDVAKVGSWAWDAHTDEAVWSDQTYRIFGYQPKEIVPSLQWLLVMLHPDDSERVKDGVEKSMKTRDPYDMEYRVIRKDGKEIIVHSRGEVVLDEKGEPTGMIGTIQDITERKRAEEKLQQEIRLNKILLDGFPGFVMLLRVSTREVVISNRIARDGGADPCTQCFSTIGQRGDPCPWCLAPKVWETGQSQHIEVWALGILWDAYWIPVTEDLYLHFAFDITDRNQLEEERIKASKLESIGVLAGGIAHDFNNILTVILGNISLANIFAGEDVKKTREVLVEAERASLKATNLTQQLLTFSKGGEPVKETTSISGLIIEATEFSLRGSNVKCRHYISKDLWPCEVDAGQIGQMIDNIIINADQAMPEGGTISVRAKNVAVSSEDVLPLAEGRYVRITIKDQGTGIPEEHLPRIFDPYFTTKQTGSGLGLTTSYSIVKRHGGHLAVESERDIGTTFQIYLPASAEQAEREEEERVETAVIKGRVLVMDDKRKVREVAIRMLEHIGHEAECAKNGTQAIEMYEQAKDSGKPFDAVILDLTIPGGMGGKETIEKLKEIDSKVKAIVSSGYSNDPVMANYHDYGFRGVVPKPFKIEELRNVLHRVMKEESG